MTSKRTHNKEQEAALLLLCGIFNRIGESSVTAHHEVPALFAHAQRLIDDESFPLHPSARTQARETIGNLRDFSDTTIELTSHTPS